MCHKATVGRWIRLPLLALAAPLLLAQDAPDWRKVGGSAVELMLASPATGPVDQVWFSESGSVLYARTRSGRIFQTADFDTWSRMETAPEPPQPLATSVARLPEAGARTFMIPADRARIYALGRQLFRSGDGGLTWANLSGYRGSPVIGIGQRGVAISPTDPGQVVVANDYGVWRSLDGGLSWSGLNRFLPNLAVRRILSAAGPAGIRILTDGMGVLELPAGGSVWLPAPTEPDRDIAVRQRYSGIIGAEISATAAAGDTVYAGSTDGRLWISIDGGATFRGPTATPDGAAGPVERIFVDPQTPRVALAALGGRGPHILRTTNAGAFWDSLQGNLPDSPAHAVTADRAAGAIYVATDSGVFWATADLENASTNPVTWTSLNTGLPEAPALDVRLDAANSQLYAALEGYGVYAVAAPHRTRNVRIVNTADYSTRPAAPGSLLSVVGARVRTVRAGDLSYPVLAASDTESQIQVPFEAAGSSVALSLETATGTVRRQLPLQPVSPAILVGRDGAPMLWDAESGLPLDLRNVARSNGRVQVWATGLGRVRPDWPTGLTAPLENPPAVAAEIKAFLDGSPMQVIRASLVPGYIGFYLIEVQLPMIVNAGQSELYVSADGQESNRVRMVIEP